MTTEKPDRDPSAGESDSETRRIRPWAVILFCLLVIGLIGAMQFIDDYAGSQGTTQSAPTDAADR